MLKNLILTIPLIFTACATPIANQPNELGQTSDEMHDSRTNNNSGQQINIENMTIHLPEGTTVPLSGLLMHALVAQGGTLTNSPNGDTTGSSSQAGATEQGATQSGQTGSQTAEATADLTVPVSPGSGG